ncbi:hypothetical protein A3K82_02730 [Candidatus Pacearchaeota archaeon RBG_19FT_COMBO_34_9]|nr:MAG: hypothetical protein A3K82_02730 [Candidatus Pacearchaeota archaeon RBG_19FT_COMBO_34_9]OGJ16972.1 MAG: hypothetical protein A3K74_01105 [Candidatus Pacearchaeota archaeon RBG_13_33_26]
MAIYKMKEDISPKNFCLELEERSPGKDEHYYAECTKGYYCSKTNGRCVGAIKGLTMLSNDRLNVTIVKRCPSRRTIDEVISK